MAHHLIASVHASSSASPPSLLPSFLPDLEASRRVRVVPVRGMDREWASTLGDIKRRRVAVIVGLRSAAPGPKPTPPICPAEKARPLEFGEKKPRRWFRRWFRRSPRGLPEADFWPRIVSECRSIDPIIARALRFVCCVCADTAELLSLLGGCRIDH